MGSIHAAVLKGIEAIPVEVEVSLSQGIPGLSIVGMADASVLESRTRIRCALKACDFAMPRQAITVSLAPAELKKSGSNFDLPIAVAILVATGQIPAQDFDRYLFAGELGLDGAVSSVRGEVAYALLARDLGLELVTAADSSSCAVAGCARHGIRSLSQLAQGSDGFEHVCQVVDHKICEEEAHDLDFADVYDQDLAKRAITIAAAGSHGLLMVGSPGAGKTMLARRISHILPPLTAEEQVETLLIHSVAGVDTEDVERGIRPFRAPHHSVSGAGLIGGGRPPRPGECALAHNGVLFLDELAEFPSNVLQTLRQPTEDGEIRLVRAEGVYVFPSKYLLVAAANPCPCGHLGEAGATCTCSESAIQRYRSRLTGPLIDRIDLQIPITKPDPKKVIEAKRGMGTYEMSAIVEQAREFRAHRERRQGTNPHGEVLALGFESVARSRLEALSRQLGYGGRGIVRVARVARTIADIEGHDLVQTDDVFEASSYRPSTEQER